MRVLERSEYGEVVGGNQESQAPVCVATSNANAAITTCVLSGAVVSTICATDKAVASGEALKGGVKGGGEGLLTTCTQKVVNISPTGKSKPNPGGSSGSPISRSGKFGVFTAENPWDLYME